jgi:hypothetical protein
MTQPGAAQQRAIGPKQPAPAGQPVQPSAGKTEPLKGPIQLEPSKVKKLSKPDPPEVKVSQVKDAYEKWGPYELSLGYIKMHMKTCSTKAYSVQDQQAAGCKGSDTVEQCMEKLFDFCMSKHAYEQENFRKNAQKKIANAHKLAQIVEAYADYLEHLDKIYGK